jgi:hypothetical protein
MPISRWKVTTKDRKSLYVKDPQFQIRYHKNTIVIPSHNAPGIFVFDTEASAERFVRGRHPEAKILRVLPMGRAIKLKGFRPTIYDNRTIYRFWKNLPETIKASENQDRLAKHLGYDTCGIERLDGTLIYPAVRVMD